MSHIFAGPARMVSGTNVTLLVVGISFAWVLRDAHTAQRTGAAIAAVTGLFVIWQVVDELRMERIISEEASREVRNDGTVLGAKAEELATARMEERAATLRRARLMLVAVIAFWIFVGEMLHGFGDFILADTLPGRPAENLQTAQPNHTATIGDSKIVDSPHKSDAANNFEPTAPAGRTRHRTSH